MRKIENINKKLLLLNKHLNNKEKEWLKESSNSKSKNKPLEFKKLIIS